VGRIARCTDLALSTLCEHHEAWTNDQSTISFRPPQDYGQAQSYCTNILSTFVIGNSHIQIVIRNAKLSMIDAFHRDIKNDIKKLTCS
jgi:hypothetical protein